MNIVFSRPMWWETQPKKPTLAKGTSSAAVPLAGIEHAVVRSCEFLAVEIRARRRNSWETNFLPLGKGSPPSIAPGFGRRWSPGF
jgi:hypothetical protein